MRKKLFITISVIVLLITLIPLPKRMQLQTHRWDKAIHFSLFSILGFFAQAVLSIFALFYGTILAIVTEVLQKFIPGRVPDVVDFGSNIMGLIIGTSFWELVKKRG
ncbi:MAG: VanZ family protein [Candidatus Latescibacteria bacterium]|nr:VanZ family protein [Candidatus Latescibacterota bacterium]